MVALSTVQSHPALLIRFTNFIVCMYVCMYTCMYACMYVNITFSVRCCHVYVDSVLYRLRYNITDRLLSCAIS